MLRVAKSCVSTSIAVLVHVEKILRTYNHSEYESTINRKIFSLNGLAKPTCSIGHGFVIKKLLYQNILEDSVLGVVLQEGHKPSNALWSTNDSKCVLVNWT